MVADLVAIPRQSSVLTGAPRSPEPSDRAGHIENAFSVFVVVISILMPVLNNISLQANKMIKHNYYRVTVGPVKHYGCEPVYGGIHNHLKKWTSCGIHEEFEQLEVKPVHPDLPGKNLNYDGIVRTNLTNTACTASVFDANEKSIFTAEHVGVRELHGQHEHVTCTSSSSSSLVYTHGIDMSNYIMKWIHSHDTKSSNDMT